MVSLCNTLLLASFEEVYVRRYNPRSKFQPEEEGKAHVINVVEYFQNKEKFLEILRSESAFEFYFF